MTQTSTKQRNVNSIIFHREYQIANLKLLKQQNGALHSLNVCLSRSAICCFNMILTNQNEVWFPPNLMRVEPAQRPAG